MNKTIAVVIPLYNEEKFIAATLDSLMKQTVKPNEIIVVNNNSTDRSVEIVSRYPVTMITEMKKGITYARNAGFSYATSDVIARTDADSIVPPTWIEDIEKDFKQPIDAFSGPIEYVDLPQNTLIGRIYSRTTLYFAIGRFLQNGREALLGLNLALTKEMWEKVKDKVCDNSSLVHEDLDLGIHILKEGGVIKYDPHIIVKTSARRILYNPSSFFIEYHFRLLVTIFHKFAMDFKH